MRVTGAPSGFLAMMYLHVTPLSSTILSPRNSPSRRATVTDALLLLPQSARALDIVRDSERSSVSWLRLGSGFGFGPGLGLGLGVANPNPNPNLTLTLTSGAAAYMVARGA